MQPRGISGDMSCRVKSLHLLREFLASRIAAISFLFDLPDELRDVFGRYAVFLGRPEDFRQLRPELRQLSISEALRINGRDEGAHAGAREDVMLLTKSAGI